MYRIGEFSKLAQVSGHLLRHYDEIGLFQPQHTDPATGYRYYSAEQLPRLNRILALRNLGLSLEQITRMVHDNISAAEIQGMLRYRKAQIEQALAEEAARLRDVEVRLHLLQEEGTMPAYEAVIKAIPARRIMSVRETLPQMDDWLGLFLAVHGLYLQSAPAGSSNLIAIDHSPESRTENVDIEMGFIIGPSTSGGLMLPDQRALAIRELDSIEEAACVVYDGSWDNGGAAYQAAARWIELSGYVITGALVELFLVVERERVMFELQIPVRKYPGTFA
jgi:DNA-binding transcriptional MerR regulator